MAKNKTDKQVAYSKISEMPTKKLKSEFMATHHLINVEDCFGIKDLVYLDGLEKELMARNIKINFTLTFYD